MLLARRSGMSLTIGNPVGNALRICCIALVPLLVACPGGQSPDGPVAGQSQPGGPQQQPGQPGAAVASACGAATTTVEPPLPPPATQSDGLTLTQINFLGTLSDPVFMTAPPVNSDLRLFVVERRGVIKVIDSILGLPVLGEGTFLDISSLVPPAGEGLLSLAFDPQYANNGRFYVSYVDAATGNMVVARYSVSANPNVADPNSAVVIITSPAPLGANNGGMIAFGPGNFLYIGWGDGGSDVSQNLGDLRGKILSIDVNNDDFQNDAARNYAIPGDGNNPCVGQAGALPEIWSMGLRNPRRFTFNGNLDLYIGEVGETHEEINVSHRIGQGSNYGWRITDGRDCFPNPASACDKRLITQPRIDFPRAAGSACSVIGGHVYRGGIQALRGAYFYANSCTGSVFSFRFDRTAEPVGTVTEHTEWRLIAASLAGGTIASFGEDAQGELYIITQQGGVFRVTQ
jgi:glucose/arabinose dehydrogenase